MQTLLVVEQSESTSLRDLELVPKSTLSAFVVRDWMHAKRKVNVGSPICMKLGTKTRYAFGAIQ